ncbi:MAG TPA: hypothetical protein PL131_06770 [Methylotenera sp.]|nr:hypothetical protein [Methylotenera sp.]HPH05562.1 hypothetical protein [Methylotenera sp.]HPN00024.1 hypothetical protein [Methylotenera sp.]
MQFIGATRVTSKNIIILGMVFSGLFFSYAGHAQPNMLPTMPKSLCSIATTIDSRQQPVYFTQQTFEDNVQELAIIALDEQKTPVIKRITYHQKQSDECHFLSIAIARAGDWGWFLAWTHADKAYYARMDGEALVFPPPKLLPVSKVTNIEFLMSAPQPSMRLQTADGKTVLLISEDEGRHWQVAPAKN